MSIGIKSKPKSLVHALLASTLLFSSGVQAALIPLIVDGINLAGIIPVIPPLDTALLNNLIYNNNIQISILGQLSGSSTAVQANSLARVIQIAPLNINLANPGDAIRISGTGNGVEFEVGGNNSTLAIGSGSNINILGSGSGVLVDSLVNGIGIDNAGKIMSVSAPAVSAQGGVSSLVNELSGTITSTGSNALNLASGGSINSFNNQGTLSTTSNNSTINAIHSLGNILSTITNSGTISATAGNGLALLGSTQPVPAITNSGTISSGSFGSGILSMVPITGNITNAVGGLIQSSEGTGLNLTGGSVGGSILNSGTLSSNGTGSGLSSSIPVTGDIVNNATGAITSANGSALNLGSSASIVNLTNSGNIATTANNVLMNAVNSSGNITGVFSNNGTISAASGSAVALLGSTLPIASITNSGTMSSNGAGSGLLSSVPITGGITNNAGNVIQSQLGNGLNLAGGSVGGDIVNNGTLSSNATGSGLLSKAAIIGNIINNSTGSITSNQGNALDLVSGHMDGNIVNNGLILASNAGAALESAVTVGGNLLNNNTGFLHSVQGNGLNLLSGSSLNSITNQGMIASDSSSILASAVNLAGQVVGDFNNSAPASIISTTGPALNISGGIGGALNNTGTILSGGAPAVILSPTSNIVGGIVNAGLIRSATGLTAMDLSAATNSTQLINNINGTIKGDVLLSQVAHNLDTVLQMNGGTITGTVFSFGGTGARTLNIDNGTITNGITLGNNPDVINQAGGSIGNITGVPNAGQTLNIQGLVTTAGNIVNVDNLQVASGGQLTVNNTLSGLENLVLKQNPSNLPNVVDNLNFVTNSGTVIETELKDVNNFGHMVLAGSTNTLNNTVIKISLAGDSVIHAADEFVVLDSLLNPITGKVTLLQPSSQLINFIIKEAPSGLLNNQLLTLVAQLAYQAPNQVSSIISDILFSLPTIGNIDLLGLLSQLNHLTQPEITQVLNLLAPVVNGGGPRLAQNMLDNVFDSISQRTASDRLMVMVPIPSGDEDYMHRGVWTRVIGTTAHQGELNELPGYNMRSGGIIIGYDGCYSCRSMFGGAFSYSFGDVNTALDVNQQQNLQSYQLTGYFIHDYGYCKAGYIDLMAAIAYDKFSNTRDIIAGSMHSVAHGSFDGWQYGLNLESGYRFAYGLCDEYQLVPLIKVRYSNLNLHDYTETGSGLGLVVDNNNLGEFITGAGVKIRCTAKNMVPELRFNILYDWIADIQTSSATFIAGGVPFITNGLEVPHWTYNLGISLGGYVKRNLLVSLDYDLDLKNQYTGHVGSFKVKYEW